MELWSNFWGLIGSLFSIFVFLAYLMTLFYIVADLFRDRELSGGWKALWAVFLIFVPFLTALVYLFVRGAGMAERSAAQLQQSRDATDAYIRQAAGVSPSDEIAKAADLLAAGRITDAEYEGLKARALAG